MPHLEKLYQSQRNRGFHLLAINVIGGSDSLNGDGAARHLVESMRLSFPVLSGDQERIERVLADYRVRGLPMHVLVNRQGHRQPGDWWEEEGFQRLADRIDVLLSEDG